jgi:hypothetical protein
MYIIFFILSSSGNIDGLLLGDGGYPCLGYLMTPYANAQTRPQQRFNSALTRTRVRVEQMFGILKRRFGCLRTELRLTPDKVAAVVVACATLHNYALMRGDMLDEAPIAEPQVQEPINNNINTGDAMRRLLTNQYFA